MNTRTGHLARVVTADQCRMRSKNLDKGPFNLDKSLRKGCKSFEGFDREINRVCVIAGRARVCNSNNNAIAIGRVSDPDLPAAQGRLDTQIAVAAVIHGSNQGTVGIDLAAGTSHAVLVVVCSKSTCVKLNGGINISLGGGLRGRFNGGRGGSGGLRGCRGGNSGCVVIIFTVIVFLTVRIAFCRSALELLAGSHWTAAAIEERVAMLVLAAKSQVAGMIGIVVLEALDVIAGRWGCAGNDEGSDGGNKGDSKGSESELHGDSEDDVGEK